MKSNHPFGRCHPPTLVPMLRMGTQDRDALHRVRSSSLRSRYRFTESDGPFFLTCTVVAWMPVFTRQESVNIVLDSWKYLQASRGFVLFGYVILENHLHLIAQSPYLSDDIGDFKSYTARRIIDFLKEKKATLILQQLEFFKARHKTDAQFQLWQEGSHPQAIQSKDMMRQKLEYMHNNPV